MKSSPQLSKGRNDQNYFIFALAIILVIFPFFILKSLSSSILYFSLLFISIGSSLLFWTSFIPFFPESFSGFINIIQTLILSIFRSAKSTYHIQSGKFDKDYFVIQDKPKLGALLIEENSVVIAINNAGKKQIIQPGYQFIKNGGQVLHTFDFGFHHFFWGPLETDDPFRNNVPDLDLNQTHLQSLRAAQTKWQTKDEITVVPSFSIFYNFSSMARIKQVEEMLFNISDYFSAHKINGELQIEINKLIGESVTNIWKVLLEKTKSEQIISPTDQYSLLIGNFILMINTILNTKSGEDTSDSHISQEYNLLESVKPLELWETLNIKVFLKNLWIQQEVP